jgi:multidrug resistance efflux pump
MTDIHSRSCRWGRTPLRFLPMLVWVSSVVAVISLFVSQSHQFEVVGIAQGKVWQITAPVTAQLKTVSVDLFEPVSRGQTVATLDDSVLRAQMVTFRNEIERLKAEMHTNLDDLSLRQGQLQTDWTEIRRRFSTDVEAVRLRILEIRGLIETDRVLMHDAELEVKILQDLVDKNAVEPYELQKAQALYDSFVVKIRENEAFIAQARTDLQIAEQRRDDFLKTPPVQPPVADHQLDLLHKAIAVQEGLIQELSTQCDLLVLKSPSDGVVIQIQGNANDVILRRPGEGTVRNPGEVVAEGDPILVIAEASPQEILTYVPESQMNTVQPGMKVKLVRNHAPAQIVESQVTRLGPAIEQVIQRLWISPDYPEWGLPVLIKVPPEMKLAPGETLLVRGL